MLPARPWRRHRRGRRRRPGARLLGVDRLHELHRRAAFARLPPPPSSALTDMNCMLVPAVRLGGVVGTPRRPGRRGARRAAARRGRRGAPEQLVGLVELELVAAAVLLGGALDVRDPFADDWGRRSAAGGDALRLDGLGLVEEPLDLQLGLVGEPAYSPWFQIPTRIWKKPTESASPPWMFVMPDSTSEAMSGSWAGARASGPRWPSRRRSAPSARRRPGTRSRRRVGGRGRDVGRAAAGRLDGRGRGGRRRGRRAAAGAPRRVRRPAGPAGASPLMRMNLTLAWLGRRGTVITRSWLLPSSAVNLPPSTLLARNPMWPSEPKSSWPPQS